MHRTEYAKGDLRYCQYELKIIKEIIALHLEWEKTEVDDTILHNRRDLRWAYEHWEDAPGLMNKLNAALMDALKMRQFPQ